MTDDLNEITLEVTQRCFQKCLYCSSSSASTSNIRLSFDVVKQVLRDFYYLGGKIVELSGGEPLLYPAIYETIDFAAKMRLQIHLFTCANLLDKEIELDKLNKVSRFYVNLQSATRSIHDYLTGAPGSFDRIVCLIKELKARGKWVGTHLIPLSLNIDEIEEYLEFARLMKLDNVSLLRFVQQGRGRNNVLSLNNDEISHLFSTIEKYRRSSNPEFKIGCPLDFGFIFKKGQGIVSCKSGMSRCVVRPNGNVVPCPAFKDANDFIAGNVNDDSLVSIWNTSHVFRKIRDFSLEKMTGLCEKCTFLAVCRGRCPAQRALYYGNLYSGPDPYCPLGHSATES